MFDKYGQPMRPWELTLTFRMDELDLPKDINYTYIKCSEVGNSI